MAIGTGLALLGSAAIGAIGSAIGGSKQAKAATQAANLTSQDNAQNRAFQQGIYNSNYGLIYPTVQQGQTAGNAVMALLGYPQAQPQQSAFANYGASPITGLVPNGFDTSGYLSGGNYGYGVPIGQAADSWSPDSSGTYGGGYGMPQQAQGAVTTSVPSAQSAFDTYRGSTGYDFRVNEGVRALQSAFSRNLESGAASKAAIRFGQGTASDEFARYMGYLTGQQQLGLGGASALAGVSQNFANNVVAGNQSAASAQANARLYAGNSAANMWQNLGSSFGQALGAFGK